jgi:hypothetical protein
LKSKSYLLTATVNDKGGQLERIVCALLPTPLTALWPAV